MGKPIKGARIRPALVDVEDIGFEPPEFLSDANGHVTLKGVSEGEYGSYFFVEAETTAGEFAAKLIWYPGKERSRWVGKQPPGTLLVEGENFEIRLPAPDPLILEFVDKENRRPAKIESAEFWTLSAPDSLRQWSHKRIPIEGNKIKFGFLRPGLNFISIKMNPESMLPDQLIKIKRTAGAKPLGHQRIEVLRGSRVSGRVVEKGTLQPIADAAVAYIARDPAAQRRDGILTPTYVRTDQNGRFELIVPAAEAKLRVAGECGPFCVPPVEEGISSGGSAIDRSKFIEDFEIKIDPKPGETIDLTAFELERSKLIRGQVRDQDGAAAPFAEFLVDRSSYQSNGSPIYGSTDEQGRFELDNVLTNALTDLPFGNRQRRIIFWDRDRTLLGQAEFSKETENELEVVLKPAHAVLGRVVDGLTGKPIANAMLTVNGNHRLEIGAKSANDGTFLLEFISEQGGSINASYAGYQTNRATVKFAKNQVLKEIDDIAITAYDAYGSPERVPNLGDDSLGEALSVLDGYLQSELNRIPETQPGYDWNSAEPQFIFKTKVAAELKETVEKLLERFTEPQDRVRMALLIFGQLSQDRSSNMIPYTDTTRLLYSEVLLKNMDNPVVMEAVKSYQLQWSSDTHPGIVLEHSQTDAAKLWAVRKLVGQHSTLMMGLHGPKRLSDEQFQLTIKNMNQAWLMGLNEYSRESSWASPPGMKVSENQLLGNIIRNQLKSTQQQISDPNQTFDKERAAKVSSIIDLLMQEAP